MEYININTYPRELYPLLVTVIVTRLTYQSSFTIYLAEREMFYYSERDTTQHGENLFFFFAYLFNFSNYEFLNLILNGKMGQPLKYRAPGKPNCNWIFHLNIIILMSYMATHFLVLFGEKN